MPTLDGWRGIAILAVIADHLTAYSFRARFPRLSAAMRMGPNGVSLFFAISGFLICSRLLEESQSQGRISLSGFYVRRASRILPPAMTYLSVIAVLSWLGIIVVSAREWWSAVLFFRNYLPASAITKGWGAYTIHYWSLAVEEHFYLIWPAVLVLSGIRRAKWVALGVALAIAGWRAWDFHHDFFNRHVPGLLFGSRSDVRLDGLLVGCLAALLVADPRWHEIFLRIGRSWGWAACVLAYAAIQFYYRQHYYTLLESGLLACIVAATVLTPETWVGRTLELRGLRWIGRLSYSLYLWQQLFLVPGAKYPWSLLQRFPWNCCVLLVVAAVSYEFIERPLIRLGHKLAPPPTPGREDLQHETTVDLLRTQAANTS